MVNLDIDKERLKRYVNDYQYYVEINNVLVEAEIHILKHLKDSNPCIVLDVDQTAIDQYNLMLYYDFGWFADSYLAANIGTDFPAIKETLAFYNKMVEYLPVIFLTSRRQKYDEYTVKLLANAGFKGYTKLITRPDDDKGTIQEFKIKERQKLVDAGLTIIANIGDQQSDLEGGYPESDYCFKLPNPFYLITSEM